MKVAQHEVLGRRSNKRYVPDDPSVLALAALRARRKAERFDRPWRLVTACQHSASSK